MSSLEGHALQTLCKRFVTTTIAILTTLKVPAREGRQRKNGPRAWVPAQGACGPWHSSCPGYEPGCRPRRCGALGCVPSSAAAHELSPRTVPAVASMEPGQLRYRGAMRPADAPPLECATACVDAAWSGRQSAAGALPTGLDAGSGLGTCPQPSHAPPPLAACGAVERNRDGAHQRHLPGAQWAGAEEGQGVLEDGGAQVWRVLLHAHEAAWWPQHGRRGGAWRWVRVRVRERLGIGLRTSIRLSNARLACHGARHVRYARGRYARPRGAQRWGQGQACPVAT